MNAQKKTRVLVAPLDWGLGHATRCIPLIRYLRQKGCEVVLATSGAPASLLTREFPGIELKKLDGYNIRYSSGSSLLGSLLLQLPAIISNIRKEHKWLNELLKKEEFDFIISDNRPGFYHKKVYSVYITHQLLIHSGKGKWLNGLLQQVHARYMKRFKKVWVPDLEGTKNLAGELSHPLQQLVQPTYLGLLSRFETVSPVEPIYNLMVLLSGPEPQRSILEQKLYHQLQTFTGTVLFVRGLPHQQSSSIPLLDHITVHAHLPADQLQQAIASSELVLCRSGYTTLMDLIKLKKKAVLIPTPGQTEQEYLATHLKQQHLFPFVHQDQFDVETALQTAQSFSYEHPFTDVDFNSYQRVMDELLKSKLLF